MKISKIYEKYKIMPQLQLHQLRVAGMASVIADCFQKPLNKDVIISACLLHDMGNIIKFDLELFPKSLREKGLAYWESVQEKFKRDYGKDEHKATYKICKEVGVDNKVLQIVKAFGFSNAKETHKSDSFESKIGAYSDMRVSPHGVDTLQNRIDEGVERYKKNPKYKNKIELMKSFWEKVEEQIFFHCKIGADDITANKVDKLIKDLKAFEVKTK